MCGICGYICITAKGNSTKSTSDDADNANNSLHMNDINNVSSKIKVMLEKIQHRGYDGSGIAVSNKTCIKNFSNIGKLDNVFNKTILNDLNGTYESKSLYGIGHTRYQTHGKLELVQPILNKYKNIALVHNGHVNAQNYELDSQYILDVFEDNMYETSDVINESNIFNSVEKIFKTIMGAYSCIILIHNVGLLIFRDPKGIRPLSYSVTDDGIYIASESCAIDTSTINTDIIDVLPGEAILFKPDNMIKYQTTNSYLSPCIFEYIYLAHPKSVLDKISVAKAREEFGKLLGNKIKKLNLQLDYVVPVPDSSCIAAKSLAQCLDIEYNRIIDINPGRTFILPTQEKRKEAIKKKFIFNLNKIKGKNIFILDDSIVRGSTISHIVENIKLGNPNKIYVGSTSPQVIHKNIFGISVPDTSKLIAYDRSCEEIASIIGVDKVIYQDLNEMKQSLKLLNKNIYDFECCLFDGKY